MNRKTFFGFCTLIYTICFSTIASAQLDYEQEPINYSTAQSTDRSRDWRGG